MNFAPRNAVDQPESLGDAAVRLWRSREKQAGDAKISYGLKGKLYLSNSGWLLLSVPNALGIGAFKALNETGAELPLDSSGRYNAHVSVMRPEEIEEIGGPHRINERGKEFSYTLGPVREVKLDGRGEMSKVWCVEIHSGELEKLRKSYGLSSLPKNNEYQFHCTFAVRRKNVLRPNTVTKQIGGKSSLIHNPQSFLHKNADAVNRTQTGKPRASRRSLIHQPAKFLKEATSYRVKVARLGDHDVVVDRPRGFIKKFPTPAGDVEKTYPVDYGYLKGLINPDDQEDADVFLGSDGPHYGRFMKGQNLTGEWKPDERKWYAKLTPEELAAVKDLFESQSPGLLQDFTEFPDEQAFLADVAQLAAQRQSREKSAAAVTIRPSSIDGKGLFAAREFAPGDVVISRAMIRMPGVDGQDRYEQSEESRFTTHSADANIVLRKNEDVVEFVATKPICCDEEITGNYYDTSRVLGPGCYLTYQDQPYNGKSTSGNHLDPDGVSFSNGSAEDEDEDPETPPGHTGDDPERPGDLHDEAKRALEAEDAAAVEKYAVAGTSLARRIANAGRKTRAPNSAAQAEAGNYRKGKVSVHGLTISIENPKGSTRSGTDPDGKEWSQEMKSHYGYILGTVGRDKDHLDVFLGPRPEMELVFIVNQVDPKTGRFDEHKIMVGYATEREAKQAYLENYEEGWKGLGSIRSMTMSEFKDWLKKGNMQKRAALPDALDNILFRQEDPHGRTEQHWDRAVRAVPPTYRLEENPLENLLQYIHHVDRHTLRQVAEAGQHERMLNAANPDRRIRQLQRALAEGQASREQPSRGYYRRAAVP